MQAAGIIAEYNPFHNGHARHIAETRRITGCDCIIVAMNTSISQRGEMMLLDKWTRTKMALSCGADFVFELPALWGICSAEGFAKGGVGLLHALGCRYLSFGCETNALATLTAIAELLAQEPPAYQESLRAKLQGGTGFPAARAAAIAENIRVDSSILAAPNAALAVEYLRVMHSCASPMQPIVVLRAAPHHKDAIDAETSASAIRAAVLRGDIDSAQIAMPQAAYTLLRENRGAFPSETAVDIALLSAIRAVTPESLAALPDVSEGIENLLWKHAQTAGTREELLSLCQTKRYTNARLSRIMAHAMLKTDRNLYASTPTPPYARLLGCRKSALPLLPLLEKQSALPIITRARALSQDMCFSLECRATDLRALMSQDAKCRKAATDFTQKLIVAD